MIYCKECGKVNPDGTKFCGGCGTPLEQPEVVVQAQPVVEQLLKVLKVKQNVGEYLLKSALFLVLLQLR